MKTKLTSLMTVILIAIFAVGFTDCRKQEFQDSVAPGLPPIESMSIPLKGFTTKSGINNSKSYLWYGVSTLYIRMWNEIISSTLTFPEASFTEAFNHKSVQVKDNLWQWTYHFTVLAEEYISELQASLDGKEVIKGSFLRFKWFTGISKHDGTSGSWVIYKSPTEINELYGIDWQKNHKDGTSEVTFTNLYHGKFNKYSYINYKKTMVKPYDATYTIYDGPENKIVAIQWNSLTNEGSIKLTHNKKIDGPHYWDLNKTDLLACPY